MWTRSSQGAVYIGRAMTLRLQPKRWRQGSQRYRPYFLYYRSGQRFRYAIWMHSQVSRLPERWVAGLLARDELEAHWFLTLLKEVWVGRQYLYRPPRWPDGRLEAMLLQFGYEADPANHTPGANLWIEFDTLKGTFHHVPLLLRGRFQERPLFK